MEKNIIFYNSRWNQIDGDGRGYLKNEGKGFGKGDIVQVRVWIEEEKSNGM